MKPRRLKELLAFAFPAVILAASSVADRPAKPPKANEVARVYVGYSDYDDFYRLDLRPDFTGWFANVAPRSSVVHDYGASTYRITRWSLTNFTLLINLMPTDAKSEGIDIKGRVDAFEVVRLEVSGTTNAWQRKMTLYGEGQTRMASEETREAIKRAEER